MSKTSSQANWNLKISSEKVDAGKITHSRLLSAETKAWWVHDVMSPLESFFIRHRFHPNSLSLIGLGLNTLSAICIGLDALIWGGWLLFIAGSFDFLDGRVARATNQVSQAGGFFDSVLDRYMDTAIFFGLAWLFRDSWVVWLVYLGLLGTSVTSYVRAKAESLGLSCSGGAMQRPERILYIGAGCILSGYYECLRYPFEEAGYDSNNYILIAVLAFIAIVSNIVGIQRFREGFASLKARS